MRGRNLRLRTLRWLWVAVSVLVLSASTFLSAPWHLRFTGLAITWLLATFTGVLVRWSVDDTSVPEVVTESGVTSVVNWDAGRRGPFVLGLMEATLFYAAFAAGEPALAGAWLLFKTAAKWAAWQHIMQIPQTLVGVNDLEYLEFKHGFASRMFTVFLIGTISNLLVAGAGHALVQLMPVAS